MAKFRVVLQSAALHDLDEAFRFAAAQAPETAVRWLNRFYECLKTLDERPDRCPLAPENRRTQRVELREYLYGRRPNVFRAIFLIDGQTVRILRIRRASRRFLSSGQVDDALDDSSA